MKRKLSLFLILLFLIPDQLKAEDEARARVYKKDPELTPVLEEVILEGLDGSGYLRNPYLKLFIKDNSRYDYPASSPAGDFIYEPKDWDYYNISPEGIKFDQVSAYYYLTLARKYFHEHLGFEQSLDGQNPDQLEVEMFYDDAVDDPYFRPPMLNCGESGCRITVNVPADPQYQWAPNYYRAFSVLMHEYSHYVFQRFRQNSQFQRYQYFSDAQIVDESYAVFWPASIMDEPRYGRSLCSPKVVPPYLVREAKYDPGIRDTVGRFTNMIDALTTTLWGLREHPRIGKTIAEKIVYESMALIPHSQAQIADVAAACVQAKASLAQDIKEALYDQSIIGVFAKHDIPLRRGDDIYYMTFVEIDNDIPSFMRVGETKEITIKFRSNALSQMETPGLIPFNPAKNPNVDNQAVITTYSWGIENEVYPGSLSPLYSRQEFAYSFHITAPLVPGVYACDWAIKLDGQIGYISSNDVIVSFLRGDANGDGRIDLADAGRILGYLFTGAKLSSIAASDVNTDAEVNLADTVYLLDYLFAGGPAPK